MTRPRLQLGDWAFTWDPRKAEANVGKHGVSFSEAAWSFLDPHGLDGVDQEDPTREKLIAMAARRLEDLDTVYVEVEGPTIRIISARRATRAERRSYEESGRGGRVVEPGAEEDGSDYRWRRNPYAAALDRAGVRILASALPPGARTFASWRNRHHAPPPKRLGGAHDEM